METWTVVVIPPSVDIPDDVIEGAIVEVSGSAVVIDVAAIEEDLAADEPFKDDEATALEEFEGDLGVVPDEIIVVAG